ncbi:MAG TPA: hypothetical protein PKD84_04495 [Propionicimonas sp.]|nr:hypothetical protein [Propionicimonas sp.]
MTITTPAEPTVCIDQELAHRLPLLSPPQRAQLAAIIDEQLRQDADLDSSDAALDCVRYSQQVFEAQPWDLAVEVRAVVGPDSALARSWAIRSVYEAVPQLRGNLKWYCGTVLDQFSEAQLNDDQAWGPDHSSKAGPGLLEHAETLVIPDRGDGWAAQRLSENTRGRIDAWFAQLRPGYWQTVPGSVASPAALQAFESRLQDAERLTETVYRSAQRVTDGAIAFLENPHEIRFGTSTWLALLVMLATITGYTSSVSSTSLAETLGGEVVDGVLVVVRDICQTVGIMMVGSVVQSIAIWAIDSTLQARHHGLPPMAHFVLTVAPGLPMAWLLSTATVIESPLPWLVQPWYADSLAVDIVVAALSGLAASTVAVINAEQACTKMLGAVLPSRGSVDSLLMESVNLVQSVRSAFAELDHTSLPTELLDAWQARLMRLASLRVNLGPSAWLSRQAD